MELSSSDKERIQHQYDALAKKTLVGEAKSHRRTLAKRAAREVTFSDLSESELAQLFTTDEYESDYFRFQVSGFDVLVKNVPIVKDNAVAVLTATALPAYQAGRLFLLRRCHAVKGTVRPAFQRRQVFIGVISHAFPPFCFPLPFSPKRFPAPCLRRVPNRGPHKVVRLCGERSRSGASELSPSGGSE